MKIAETDGNSDQNLELIIAQSALHLGRLTFLSNQTSSTALNYLNRFYKKVKNADNKEFVDVGRVNLGMFKGTEKMDEYKQQIKELDYNKFLANKLEYKGSQ